MSLRLLDSYTLLFYPFLMHSGDIPVFPCSPFILPGRNHSTTTGVTSRSSPLLFDAEGAVTLKLGRWFGGDSTILDRTAISRKDRDEIAMLLGTSADSLPDTYGNLLRFLKGRGLRVCVNKRALEQSEHIGSRLLSCHAAYFAIINPIFLSRFPGFPLDNSTVIG